MSSVTSTDLRSQDASKKAMTEPGEDADAIPPPVNYFMADFALRLLLLATTLTALLVLLTSKQTLRLLVPFPPYSIPRTAKFTNSPAFIYLVVALAVGCLYSILTIVASVINRSSPSAKLLFLSVISDAVMAGALAAGTGTGGAVAYVGLRGNSHVMWDKVCNVFDKFCRHIGGAVAVTLVASLVLVALVALSSYSLYRRSR